MTDRWLNATDRQRARGARRAAAVREVRARDVPGARVSGDVLHQVAVEFGVAISTLRRWMSAASRPEVAMDRARSGRPGQAWKGAGAEAAWGLWLTDYLRLEKPTAVECYRRLARIARVREWALPSSKAFLRRLKAEVPAAEVVRARDGALALNDLQPAQERSVAGLAPLDIINGDGKRHDVVAILPGGAVGRPVVWYWQDVRTRRILAWKAGETESGEMVRLSLRDLIMRHGVPRRVLVDSTRAAANTAMTGRQGARKRRRGMVDKEVPGILHTLGIDFTTTTVDRDAAGRGKGRGRAKPVERAFADMAHYIDTHPLAAGAYTGRSPVDRPETHRQRPLDWATFERLVAEGVAEYNARTGRQTEAAAGRSFDECWRDEIATTIVRRLSAAQSAMLLLAVEATRVKRDGTFALKAGRASGLPKNRYHNVALAARAGEDLVVRFDPAALHDEVFVFDQAGRFVCAATCLIPVGFADSQAAKEHERQRRAFRKATDKSVRARERMDDLREALAEAPLDDAPEATPAALRLVSTDADAPSAPARKARQARGTRRRLLDGLRRAVAED